MSKTVADAIAMAQEVKMVDLRFTDLLGMWHHFSIPTRELTQELFEEGIGFEQGDLHVDCFAKQFLQKVWLRAFFISLPLLRSGNP